MAATDEQSGEADGGRIWWSLSGGVLTVGMTGAAMSQVGEAEDVSLPEAGESVSGGDILFSCEGSTGSYDWACPLDATIKAVNPRVVEEPGTLNEDSLEEGWLVKLEGLDESQVSSFCKKGKA